MVEIHKETDDTLDALFRDEIILENFFAGASRGELLGRMKNALANGVPLMVLSGGEGSGKTMMCRMLENECPSSIIAVYFPSTVESFEDVVRIVAQRLGLQLSATDEGWTVDAGIEQIITHLFRQSKGLLVIFDEAEDIYLATLERIRKMLDRITSAGVRMQILFSGRKTFLENCEQLSICDFRNTEDLHFDLTPLSEAETSEYLHCCLERLPSPDKRKVFNDEVVRNIHALAKGKFRRIKMLAGESLRSHGNDTSFMVLLDSVQDEAEAEEDKEETRLPLWRRLLPYLWWIGGALCTLVLLFFLLRPGDGRRSIKPVSLPVATDKVKMVPVAQTGGGAEQSDAQVAAQKMAQPASQQPEVSSNQVEVVEQKVSKTEASPSLTEELLNNVEKKQSTPVQITATDQPTTVKELEPLSAPAQKVVTVPETKVPELRQIPPLKVKPANSSEPAVGAVKTQPRVEVQETVGASAHLTVDQIYQKRLSAGAVWASGEKNNKFTVQLMVLTAKNAELNLKKMLAQPSYRQEAGNFYIFKKNGSPEVVLVFYGEYPNIDLARLAQNSLPQFLRDHQPYAISVKGAIAKVGK